MFHASRIWKVVTGWSEEELAKKLSQCTWTCCSAFQIGDYYWLNDSTGPDGCQEYAVLKKEDCKFYQLESITFGWCDETKALKFIKRTLSGGDDQNDWRKEVKPILQTPTEHLICYHCA